MADALRSSMETIILLNMHSFIWESILFILYGTDKKSLRITVLSINHFDALLCGYSWACRWQTVHGHRAKVIAQRMPTMLRLVKKRSFFRRHIEFLPHHVNVRLENDWLAPFNKWQLVQWNRSHFFQLLSRESNRLNGLFQPSTLFNIGWTGAATLLINQCRTVGQQLHDRFILLYENIK